MFEKGQVVYVKPLRDVSTKGELIETTVESVGRKWIHIGRGWRLELGSRDIDGAGYSSPGRVYISRQEHADECALESAWGRLRQYVSNNYRTPSGVTQEMVNAAMSALELKK